MDEEFLQRAKGIELRLEAEGMIATAEAVRNVVDAFIVSTSNVPHSSQIASYVPEQLSRLSVQTKHEFE